MSTNDPKTYTVEQVQLLLAIDHEQRREQNRRLELDMRRHYEQSCLAWREDFSTLSKLIASLLNLFISIDKDAGYAAIPQARDFVRAGLMGHDERLQDLYRDFQEASAAFGNDPLPIELSAHIAARVEAIRRFLYHGETIGLVACAKSSGVQMIIDWFEALPDYNIGGNEGFRPQLFALIEAAREAGLGKTPPTLFESVRRQLAAKRANGELNHTWEYRALDKLDDLQASGYEDASQYMSELRRAAKVADKQMREIPMGEHVLPCLSDVIE